MKKIPTTRPKRPTQEFHARKFFDQQATEWDRLEPLILSDFVVRPVVVELLREVCAGRGSLIGLDLGCGEGYFSRQIRPLFFRLTGLDISQQMIDRAQRHQQALAEKERAGHSAIIDYVVEDMLHLAARFRPATVDIVLATLSAHYLKPGQLPVYYEQIATVLRDKGHFLLTIPHPQRFISCADGRAISVENAQAFDYALSRGRFFRVSYGAVNGARLHAGYIHSSLSDHFTALENAGLDVVGSREPTVSEDLGTKYPVGQGGSGEEPLFGHLVGTDPYLIVSAQKR